MSSIAPEILVSLEKNGFIPVISPIGVGNKGEAFNINADYVASAIASAMNAEKLLLLTDVPGIKNKSGDAISSVNKKEIKGLIEDGTVSGGMLPKVQSCTRALENGVKKTHIVDGRIPHCLLLEIFTKKGIGTEIINI